MTLLVLFLCVFFYLGKAQNYEQQPEFAVNETYMNLGPSLIHSVKGKFYEEKQREIASKPKTYNENIPRLNSEGNIASQSQLHNNSTSTKQQGPTNSEKILYRRNKDSSNNIKEPKSQKNDIFTNYIPMKPQEIPTDDKDSMLFQTEKIVTSYDKNSTIETIKKEVAFDSLLIKNGFSDTPALPKSVMNSYMNYEINPEADIVRNPVLVKVNAEPTSNRRFLETNTNHEPLLPNHFQTPLADENNFKPSSNFGNNMPNNINIPSTELLRQNKKPIIDENKSIPITHFEPSNYGKNMPINRNKTLRQNNYNVKDERCDEQDSDEIFERSGNDIQLNHQEPTKGLGISYLRKSGVTLLDHPRACYACSSINDPVCWSPDRTTAVKYCRTDHPSCLTKLYKYKGLSYIIRDCGNTCEQSAIARGSSKYTYCTICYHDLCNSAHHFKIENMTFLMLLIFHFCSLY